MATNDRVASTAADTEDEESLPKTGDSDFTKAKRLASLSGTAPDSHSHTTHTTDHQTNDRPHCHYHHDRYLQHRPNSNRIDASSASTPSRTRSTSSSNSTPLSTFPSSVSPALATTADRRFAKGAASAVHVSNGDSNAAHDTAPLVQLHQTYSYLPQDSAFLAAPSSQPQSLPASQSTICSRARRKGGRSSGASQESARHSQCGSEEGREKTDKRPSDQKGDHRSANGDGGEEERENDSGNDDDTRDEHRGEGEDEDNAGSLDSHTLAWDQTRLRIAYLVSTMMTPSPNTSARGGSGRGDAEGPNATTSPLVLANAPTSSASPPGEDVDDDDNDDDDDISVLSRYIKKCPRGWTHLEPDQKRQKVAQTLCWQSEIMDLDRNDVYCACAVGCAVQEDEPVLDLPVRPFRRARPISPSKTPHVEVDAISPISSACSSTALPPPRSPPPDCSVCSGCGQPLTPTRVVIFVSGSADDFSRPRRDQDGRAASSFRKAIKGLRGFMSLAKRKKGRDRDISISKAGNSNNKTDINHNHHNNADKISKATRAHTHGAENLRAPTRKSPLILPRKKHTTDAEERLIWEDWETANCERLREEIGEGNAAMFFPQTGMYGKFSGEPAEKEGELSAIAALCTAHDTVDNAKAAVIGQNGHGHIDEEYDVDDLDDDGNDDKYDPVALERQRKREMEARLKRAQALLASQLAATADK